jgi:hypothetical protein
MSIYLKFFAPFLLALLYLYPSSTFGQWHGVVPLQSNRDDVLARLGKPTIERPGYTVHLLDGEKVSIQYTVAPCRSGKTEWNVPTGTVIRIWVKPRTPVRLEDLKIKQSLYKRENDPELLHMYYLISDEEGAKYSVDDSAGIVTMMEYFPSRPFENLKCRSQRNRGL